MGLLFWKKKKEFFRQEEKNAIVAAIKEAELMTSGEVRVFVESRCRFVDALDRAGELFFRLEMDQTEARNAVLVYIAMKDRQLAVFGDKGIHEKVGTDYWNQEVKKMTAHFRNDNFAEGIRQCIKDIGASLQYHFPYDHDTDKNELPDDIIFGK